MRKLRRAIWQLTPPVAIAVAERLTRAAARFVPRLRTWEYVPEGWVRQRTGPGQGWNVEGVVDAYKAKLPGFAEALTGRGPIGLETEASILSTESGILNQNRILAYAYALALAGGSAETVSVLDWGGGIGQFYLLAKALLPPEVRIDYHIKEVPVVCAHGRQVFPEIRFYDDESCLERRYDLVFASGSLQYSEDWTRTLERLAAASNRYLFLTRVPIVFRSRSFVVLQRVPKYKTEYVGWVLNRHELLESAAASGAELIREFLLGYKPFVFGAPEQYELRAFLFRPHRAAGQA